VKFFFQEKKITPQKGSFSKMIKCATVMSQDLFQQGWKATKGKKTDKIKKIFYLPMFFGIRDPGSEIRDGKKPGSGIRDKHPGSATLPLRS
jgi:hypothetical protein